MNEFEKHISEVRTLHVQQVWEGWEIVLGFESRNKYKILDENLNPLAYAAEESTGILGTLFRLSLGHFRSFKIIIFNERREKNYQLVFPFRWFFKTLFVKDMEGRHLGRLQERFSIFRKKFDVHDSNGKIVARVNSSYFRMWTFEFFKNSRSIGKIQKKWSGAFSEIFTDRDNFVITYKDPSLDSELKILMLATCLMADIIYFENNEGKKIFN